MKLTPKQNEYIRDANHRWNLKVGAVRSGKSYGDIANTIPYQIRSRHGKDGLNFIIGVSRDTIERNVLRPMREIYTDRLIGTINSRNVAHVCGEEVFCIGAEKVSQVAKIQGASVKYCYGDEIAKWNPEVFELLKSRLDKPYSRFDGACNPESPGHWLKDFIDSKDIDIYVQKYTIFDNPALPQSFIENLCKEYAGTIYYQRYILGEWALAEGLIYPMYESAIAEPEGPAERRVVALDYGTMNAFAAGLWELHRGVWYMTREYYYSGRDSGSQKTDEEYAQDIDKWLEDLTDYNQYNKLKVIIDPSAASFIALLRKRGKYQVVPADNAVLDGIRETATCMQTGKIKFSKACVNWKKEVQGYVWDENAAEDRPVKINDHAQDLVRYFVKTMHIAKQKSTYVPLYMR